MEQTDALGRRRQPDQNRGLRPLFPKLPDACRSRLLRIAMSGDAWQRLDALVAAVPAATPPRAVGAVFERLLRGVGIETPRRVAPTPGVDRQPREARDRPGDWQEWQIQKELALLAEAGGRLRHPSASRGPAALA